MRYLNIHSPDFSAQGRILSYQNVTWSGKVRY